MVKKKLPKIAVDIKKNNSTNNSAIVWVILIFPTLFRKYFYHPTYKGSAFQECKCQCDNEVASCKYKCNYYFRATHKATCKVTAFSSKCLNFYYYNHFKIYPRRTGQAGNFHSYGPVTCNKSANAIILQSSHMHVCNTYLECFHLFFSCHFSLNKISNP
jgi:hypothetical protein